MLFCFFFVFFLLISSAFETDVNECEVYGTCPQECKNTKGSYECFCAEGFLSFGDPHGTECAAQGKSSPVTYRRQVLWNDSLPEDIKCTSTSEQETHQFCSCQTTFASVVSISPLRSTQTMWTTLSTSKPWTTYGIPRDKDSVRNLLPIESCSEYVK